MMILLKISLSREDFINLAQKSNLIAVSAEINTDLDTPVSIFYKIVGNERRGFILESVDTTQQAFGRFSFVGADPFIELQVFKSKLMIRDGDLMKCIDGEPVSSIKTFMSRYKPANLDKNLPLANGGMVGYFNFEIAATFDRIRGLNLGDEEILGQFMICRVLIVLDALKNSAKLIYLAEIKSQTNLSELYSEISAKMNSLAEKIASPLKIPAQTEKIPHEPINFLKKYGEAPQESISAIEKAKEYIFAGDVFQVVPSKQFRAKISRPAFLFYRKLRQINPSPYMFYINFGKTVKLVGASPEMLVKVANKKVFTYPIAGTRRRGANSDEDLALAAELKADIKEKAEHSMLVDLARNDLGRISVAGTVKVEKLLEVEYFSHVMHMVSSVTGILKENLTPIDVLKATFPAGTVSGAPKLRAMEIIHELEPVRRKTYAGTVGYMDFCGNMDMCITLRTMRIENDVEAIIQAGAGIVADSIPQNEYREYLQKAKALFEVVEEVENHDFAAR